MRHSIFWRTLLWIAIPFYLVFSIIFGIQYTTSKRTIKQMISDNSLQKLEMIEANLQLVIDRQKDFITQFSQNKDLFSENREEIEELFKTYSMAYADISTLMLINEEGIIATNNPMIRDRVDVERFYQMSNKGRLIISKPYYSSSLAGRAIAIINSIKQKGVVTNTLLVAEIRPQTLFESLTRKNSSSETLIVLDNDGDSTYFDYSSPLIGKLEINQDQLDINEQLRTTLYNLKSSISEVQVDSKRLIVQRLYFDQRWNFYYLTDYAMFYSKLNEMIKLYKIIGICVFLLLYPIAFIISKLIVLPIKQLEKQVNQFGLKDNGSGIPFKRKDEIGSLAESFNNLLDKLKQSAIEQNKLEKNKFELEYKILQSQIQPHFMFNVHLCINSMLEQGNIKGALKMLHAFDTLLRTSTYKLGEVITLEEEVTIVREYCKLQKMRMGNSFDLNIGTYEPYKKVKVPKLLLQPIVENSIYHGILNIDHKGEINIHFTGINEELHIMIEDNGCGIDPEILKEIMNPEEKQAYSDRGMVSIGLYNVKQRIHNFYGEKYGLYVNSRKNIGTFVEVVINVNCCEYQSAQEN